MLSMCALSRENTKPTRDLGWEHPQDPDGFRVALVGDSKLPGCTHSGYTPRRSCLQTCPRFGCRKQASVPQVTSHYRLSGPVPFVNVWVEQDNRLFIEPSAIRAAARDGDRWAIAAEKQLLSYFAQVMHTVRNNQYQRGVALLARLREPNETRLGMSRVGVAGKGMRWVLADQLWRELRRNPVCQRAALVGRIEDLAPYVDRIGKDRISDACTRIAYDVLIEYTNEMMQIYPSLNHHVSTEEESVWSPTQLRWVAQQATLPVAAGKRLLLVPTSFVWPLQLLNAPSMYQVQALGRIQDAQTQPPLTRGGRPSAPSKKLLARHHRAIRPTNIAQAVDAYDNDQINFTQLHTRHVQNRFQRIRLNPEAVNALLDHGPAARGETDNE